MFGKGRVHVTNDKFRSEKVASIGVGTIRLNPKWPAPTEVSVILPRLSTNDNGIFLSFRWIRNDLRLYSFTAIVDKEKVMDISGIDNTDEQGLPTRLAPIMIDNATVSRLEKTTGFGCVMVFTSITDPENQDKFVPYLGSFEADFIRQCEPQMGLLRGGLPVPAR
jgi:hypothetical protein